MYPRRHRRRCRTDDWGASRPASQPRTGAKNVVNWSLPMALMLVLMRVQSVRKRARPSVRRSHPTPAAATAAAACSSITRATEAKENRRGASWLLNKALNNINGSIIQSRLSRARVRALYTHFFNPLAAICVELSCGGLNKLRVCQ